MTVLVVVLLVLQIVTLSAVLRLKKAVRRITYLEAYQMATIDEILTQVSELDDINDSLDALFVQLQALIQQGQQDPAKLQEALDIIVAQKERTKTAILANTPAAP